MTANLEAKLFAMANGLRGYMDANKYKLKVYELLK